MRFSGDTSLKEILNDNVQDQFLSSASATILSTLYNILGGEVSLREAITKKAATLCSFVGVTPKMVEKFNQEITENL